MEATCVGPECNRPIASKKDALCKTHYMSHLAGEELKPIKALNVKKPVYGTCIGPECEREATQAQGTLCRSHYTQRQRGKALTALGGSRAPRTYKPRSQAVPTPPPSASERKPEKKKPRKFKRTKLRDNAARNEKRLREEAEANRAKWAADKQKTAQELIAERQAAAERTQKAAQEHSEQVRAQILSMLPGGQND